MGNDWLGYDIDEYSVDKNINVQEDFIQNLKKIIV